MAGMSNYLEEKIIRHCFRTGSYSKPTVLAIALVTVAAIDSDDGSTISEVANSNNYVRQTLNPLDSNWSDVSSGNGTTENLSNITFPEATGDWGTVVGIAICDDANWGTGNVLFHGVLSVPKLINNGSTFSFASGDLKIVIN